MDALVSRPLHALDAAAAENSLRPHHQDQNHQHVGRKVLGAAADIGIEVAGSEILDDADNQPADHRTQYRVETAEDHDRKHFQPDQRELIVNAQHRSPHNAAERRDDPRHRPGEGEIAPDIDAHRHRHLLAVGYGAHGDADAAAQ